MRASITGPRFGRLLVVLVLILVTAGTARAVVLTDLEQYYLDTKGEVSLCVDPDWVPFERINEAGEHEGIAADLLRLVSSRTGLRFKLVPTASWDESLEAAKNHRCRILSFLNRTDSRSAWLTFTDPLFTDVNVFITREEHPFISDPGGLEGETVALPRGTSIEELLRRDYPNLGIVLTDSEAEALRLVSERQANMALRSLIVAAYTIKKQGWFNLKIAGQLPDYADRLRIGIVGKDLVLRDILNKGIQSITAQDRGAIVNRHVSITAQTVPDYALAYKIAIIAGIALLLGAAWVRQLRRYNKELTRVSQTDMLTGLANRTRLNAVLDAEVNRARRYHHPLSVILLDLDYFKRVNDERGHLTGDAVLKEFSRILQDAIREVDCTGRWGGEEFLVVCPETDASQAAIVAGRIIDAVRDFPFSSHMPQTVSAGVTALAADDTMEPMLIRADKALYAAKDRGRDRYAVMAPDDAPETT